MPEDSQSQLSGVVAVNARWIVRIDQNFWVLIVGIVLSAAADQVLGLVGVRWELASWEFRLELANAIGWLVAAVTLTRYTLKYIILQNSLPLLEINDPEVKRECLLAFLRESKLVQTKSLSCASVWMAVGAVVVTITVGLRILAANGVLFEG